MTQLPWTPLALTARLAELGAEASFIAGSSAEDHVVATLRERTHGKDAGLQAFATKTAPAVDAHLQQVKALDKSPADDITKNPS